MISNTSNVKIISSDNDDNLNKEQKNDLIKETLKDNFNQSYNVFPDLNIYSYNQPLLNKKRGRLSSFEQVLNFENNFNFNNYDNLNQFNIRKRTLDENDYITNFNCSFQKNAFVNNEDEDILLKKSILIVECNIYNKTNANVINIILLCFYRVNSFKKKTKIFLMLIQPF